MNTLVFELAEQAGMEIEETEGTIWWLGNDDLERFAQLIIKECIKSLKPLSRNHSMVGAAQDVIREHFGVE